MLIARHIKRPPDEWEIQKQKSGKYKARRSIDVVVTVVAQETGTPRSQIFSDSRRREISEKRQLIMYLAYQMHLGSYKAIGKYFNKDHATVIHACKVIENLIETNKNFENLVNKIRRRL